MLDRNSGVSNDQSRMISLYSISFTKSRKHDVANHDPQLSTDTPQKVGVSALLQTIYEICAWTFCSNQFWNWTHVPTPNLPREYIRIALHVVLRKVLANALNITQE